MAFSFTISQYRPADTKGIREVYPEFLEEYVGLLPRGTLIVARHGGRAIGFLFTKWNEGPAYHEPSVTRYAEIMKVHVHQDFRNRGVAKSLVARALREAERRGCEAVYLETDDFNAAARRVYEKCGFAVHNVVFRYKRSL